MANRLWSRFSRLCKAAKEIAALAGALPIKLCWFAWDLHWSPPRGRPAWEGPTVAYAAPAPPLPLALAGIGLTLANLCAWRATGAWRLLEGNLGVAISPWPAKNKAEFNIEGSWFDGPAAAAAARTCSSKFSWDVDADGFCEVPVEGAKRCDLIRWSSIDGVLPRQIIWSKSPRPNTPASVSSTAVGVNLPPIAKRSLSGAISISRLVLPSCWAITGGGSGLPAKSVLVGTAPSACISAATGLTRNPPMVSCLSTLSSSAEAVWTFAKEVKTAAGLRKTGATVDARTRRDARSISSSLISETSALLLAAETVRDRSELLSLPLAYEADGGWRCWGMAETARLPRLGFELEDEDEDGKFAPLRGTWRGAISVPVRSSSSIWPVTPSLITLSASPIEAARTIGCGAMVARLTRSSSSPTIWWRGRWWWWWWWWWWCPRIVPSVGGGWVSFSIRVCPGWFASPAGKALAVVLVERSFARSLLPSPWSSSERALHQNRCPICQPLLWHCLLQYFALRQRRHLANSRGCFSHFPHNIFAHCRIPPCFSSFRHAFLIITPAQYWISGAILDSPIDAKCDKPVLDDRNVYRSATQNTFFFGGSFGLQLVVKLPSVRLWTSKASRGSKTFKVPRSRWNNVRTWAYFERYANNCKLKSTSSSRYIISEVCEWPLSRSFAVIALREVAWLTPRSVWVPWWGTVVTVVILRGVCVRSIIRCGVAAIGVALTWPCWSLAVGRGRECCLPVWAVIVSLWMWDCEGVW